MSSFTQAINNNELIEVCERHGLNDLQTEFVIRYCICKNYTKAYQQTYNCAKSTASVTGWQTAKIPKVAEALKECKRLMLEDLDVTRDDYLLYLKKTAMADIGDYLEFGSNKVPIIIPQVGLAKDEDTGEILYKDVSFVKVKNIDDVDTSVIESIKETKTGVDITMVSKRWAWEKLSQEMGWGEQVDNTVNNSIIEALNHRALDVWEDGDDSDGIEKK